ncbi:ketoacyl-ACP synthase III family protein [Actinacidiphila sp. ITFR-21]|uniref:ketoacyl-ACP synthase III family protein n=1 Tax=Actinacidiphila sp. ITFR-21 TaxID=3075199 RepID=UPI00288BD36E|nr:ketoacyl-ACP synthase III family protein [Streptomyces sp. ITFR-21]WNI16360.1 ketoacyl-ACP synthase III family protein [Streptomyces sp. ITFR-21]
MRVDNLYIAGLGSYVPEPFPAERAVAMGLYDEAEWRGSGWTGAAVAGNISAPEMAVAAGRRALARSGHPATDIALVLHASLHEQGPEMWTPHQYVLRHVLGTEVPALEVSQGCNAALGAMELAHGYLGCDPGRVAALVTAGENFGTPRLDRWRYQAGANTNRGSIVGDAGSAVVVSTRAGFARVRAMNSASLPDLEEMNRPAGPLFPPMTTREGPIDMVGRLLGYARRDPAGAAAAKKSVADARVELGLRTIAEAGITPAEITRATHVLSGGEEYIRSVLAPMGIDPGRGMLAFGRALGHMTTSDHLAALTHLVETRQVGVGDHVLMIGNSVGVSLFAAVVEITELPSWATGSPQPYEERV